VEWHKLKNIILLILLVVNGFLLVLVGSRLEEAAQYERKALEQTVQVLERGGIQVDLEAVDPAEGLFPAMVERDLEREVRMARKLTQQRISDSVGLALRSYQCYEQGVREPSLDMLIKLADVLEVPTDYLLGRDLSLLKSFDGFQ